MQCLLCKMCSVPSQGNVGRCSFHTQYMLNGNEASIVFAVRQALCQDWPLETLSAARGSSMSYMRMTGQKAGRICLKIVAIHPPKLWRMCHAAPHAPIDLGKEARMPKVQPARRPLCGNARGQGLAADPLARDGASGWLAEHLSLRL